MRRILSVAAIAVLTVASTAHAQRGAASTSSSSNGSMPIELGFDGGLSFGTGGTDNSTEFAFPIRSIRAGFMVSPSWSIEPSLGLSRVSTTNDTFTDYQVGVGALYHFSPSRAQSQLYVRPFVNLVGFNDKTQVSPTTTVSTSDSMTELGAGLGVKIPWRDRLSWRLEGALSHLSKKVSTGDTRVGLLFGMSYYTR